MKQFYTLLIALIFPFVFSFANENELHISGMVYENPNNPVPGWQVNIEIPPSNIFDGYFNEVLTNEEGFYVDEILLPENVTQGEVHLSTIDCNGQIISEMFYFSPENMQIEHDFQLCDDPFPDCQAGFFWEFLEGNAVQFINTSIPENASCIWEFGDGTTSDNPNPVHEYAEPGPYEVCLLIYNDELNCEDQICMEIIVGNNTGCEAFFDWGPAPDNPMLIAFFNQSIGGENLEYFWDFGDGETSTEMNPTHDYADPGVYPVCLEISGENCQNTFCTEVFVDEWPGECMAEFEFDIMEGNQVQFFNLSFPPESNCQWDFGDGETSEEFEPVHLYPENGTYEVCLTIWNNEFNCEDQVCKELVIGGGGGECQAFFEWGPAPDNPLLIAFFNQSIGGENLEYFWDFGDGETSTEMNPTHDYAEPGVYPVCLEISGENCQNTFCTEVFVDEWPGECMAEFEFDIMEGNQVQFFNLSSPPESNCQWDFGDGETSEEFEPLHFYPENGTYEVCLTIWNNEFNCEDQVCKELVIGGGGGECEAYYTWWPTDQPSTIQFMDYSWIENGQFHWEFGDGSVGEGPNPVHTYQQPGAYEVCLVAFNDGCEDVYCETVIAEGNGGGDCEAGFEWQQIEGWQVQFFNTSVPQEAEFYWDFGDGNSYWEHSPVHQYDQPGNYEVCLMMYTASGCQNVMCQEVNVEGNGGGELNASFEMEVNNSNPLTLQFWDTSSGDPVNWLWEFGDGTTSEEQNPVHTYEQGGNYTICLTVHNNMNLTSTYCTGVEISEAYFSGIGDYKTGTFRVFPNPVSTQATVEVTLTEPQQVTVNIYNTIMQKVKTLDAGFLDSGKQTFNLPVNGLEEGIYMISTQINNSVFTGKMIITH